MLNDRFPLVLAEKQVVVLEIGDDYQFGDGELVEILRDKLKDYL